MALEASEPAKQNINNASMLSKKLHDNVYQVPDHLKTWFSHKGRELFTEGREKYLSDDVVTWDELQAGEEIYTDSFHHQMFEELRDNIYKQKFKPEDKVLDKSNGTFYDVPNDLKKWLDHNGFWIESKEGSKLDGVITLDELHNSSRYFVRDENNKHLDELIHHIYTERFNHTGNVPVANKFYDTVYNLPKPMQEWVNQNSHKLDGCLPDGTKGNADGVISAEEIVAYRNINSLPAQDETIYAGLEQFLIHHPSNKDEIDKSFVKQIANSPENLKTWFEQHKDAIDTNDDSKVSATEMYDYGAKTKLDTQDRTMLIGLRDYSPYFANDSQKKDPEITSKDIDTALKLMRQEITPMQIAWNHTVDPTKIGAALGALSGGAMGLAHAAPLASSAYASWGTLSAGSIATCAGLTAGGAIAGALIGTAAIGGAAYGVNYFAAKDWYEKRTRAYRNLGWIK